MAGTHETSAPEMLHCYRHPDRETLLSCSTCERPICTACMTQMAVGVRCPECAGRGGGRGAAASRTRRTRSLSLSSSKVPLAVAALVAVNLIVFLAEMAQGVGLRGSTDSSLVRDGGLLGVEVADGEWWRLLSAAFLHASIVHVAFNMYLLWILGSALERYAGPLRFLAIYFAAVLWGSAGALLLEPDAYTVGASGGVFGLMAALYLLERQKGVALLGSTVGMLLLLNLAITFLLPGISIGGHIGGILGGAAAAFVLSAYGRGHLAYGRVGATGWSAVVGLLAAAVVVSLAVA